jgi:protein transport protein SEC23
LLRLLAFKDLTKDCWPTKSGKRPDRCTGAAIAVAVGLLEATHKNKGGRIMVFSGGPPSIGPGMVCSSDLKENIRSHHDIQKGNVPHLKKAKEFYSKVASQAARNGHVIDIFACSLDQVGLAEMRVCVERTGGYLVLDDSFTRGVFLNSFQRVFSRDANNDLTMAFSGELSVSTSRELKVMLLYLLSLLLPSCFSFLFIFCLPASLRRCQCYSPDCALCHAGVWLCR